MYLGGRVKGYFQNYYPIPKGSSKKFKKIFNEGEGGATKFL